MLVMTYSDARQNFASVLDKAQTEGAVLVKRADGSLFRISPEQKGKSLFEGIKTLFDLQQNDIMQALRESREEN